LKVIVFLLSMNVSINFDYQSYIMTIEISDKAIDNLLPSKV